NGDGLLDVVTAGDGGMSVLLNTPGHSGTFSAPVPYSTLELRDVATGDVDGDGDTDIVASSYGSFVVFFNDGQGGFAKQVQVSAGSGLSVQGLALVDLNGDQLLDVVLSSKNFLVFLNQGGGTFGPPSAYPSSGNLQAVAAEDLDGDGRVDLVGVGYVAQKL